MHTVLPSTTTPGTALEGKLGLAWYNIRTGITQGGVVCGQRMIHVLQ